MSESAGLEDIKKSLHYKNMQPIDIEEEGGMKIEMNIM
jgi:uncharacterized protein Veg